MSDAGASCYKKNVLSLVNQKTAKVGMLLCPFANTEEDHIMWEYKFSQSSEHILRKG